MATYELMARPDVPTGAVISEAVELATQYSTEESGRFVNGVLATIAGVVRPAPSYAQGARVRYHVLLAREAGPVRPKRN